MVEFLFHVDEWSGELEKETDESVDAAFYPLDQLPQASSDLFARHHERVFADFQNFRGTVFLK